MGRFCLRYQFMDVQIGDGDFVAGRVPDCDLVLDDVLVSRRHARFRVDDEQLQVEDLESRNGLLVNGQQVRGTVQLKPGDVVGIGAQQLLVKESPVGNRSNMMSGTREFHVCGRCNRVLQPGSKCSACDEAAQTHDEAVPLASQAGGVDTTGGRAPLTALASIADKALSLGRAQEAERIVRSMFGALLATREQRVPEADDILVACQCALRLAEITRKGEWLDYPLDLYGAIEMVVPAEMIDELYRVSGRLRYNNPTKTREYIGWLRTHADRLAPSERFSLSRLEGLERMLGSH